MNTAINITGSLQMKKRSKYLQAFLNIPVGDGSKTRPKWIFTQETEKIRAYKKFVGFIDEYENLLNDPRKSMEEKLLLIFPPKATKKETESTSQESATSTLKRWCSSRHL
jgi:hypothetical protein